MGAGSGATLNVDSDAELVHTPLTDLHGGTRGHALAGVEGDPCVVADGVGPAQQGARLPHLESRPRAAATDVEALRAVEQGVGEDDRPVDGGLDTLTRRGRVSLLAGQLLRRPQQPARREARSIHGDEGVRPVDVLVAHGSRFAVDVDPHPGSGRLAHDAHGPAALRDRAEDRGR